MHSTGLRIGGAAGGGGGSGGGGAASSSGSGRGGAASSSGSGRGGAASSSGSGGGAGGAAGSASEALFKTRENPYLQKFTKTSSLSPLSPLANSKEISTGDDLIDDFDRKIDIVYGDFEEKSANLTAMIELFIEDLKEGKKSIKDLSEKDKRDIQKRINLQEEGIARIKVGFSPVKIGTNGLKILGGRRKTKKSRTRKTRKRNT